MNSSKFDKWLENTATTTNPAGKKYTHRLLKENIEQRSEVISDLKQTVQQAHKDTKRHLRSLVGCSLDPFDAANTDSNIPSLNENSYRDPTRGYPEKLELKTLKGYFGEIFAGIVAENFQHFDISGWGVPAYPFRFHKSAFNALERWRQTGINPTVIPGRNGDDMLAFHRDQDGKITHSLVCEAKCSKGHHKSLIDKAHIQASGKESRPIDILSLIEILEGYSDSESQSWKNALRNLYLRDINTDHERFDLVSYICGKTPTKPDRDSWMQKDNPNPNYTGNRWLESVEIHLNEVDNLIKEVYDVSIQ